MSSLEDVIFPLHLVSKLSGITLFSINPKDATAKIKFLDLILFLATAVICCFAITTYMNDSFCLSLYNSEIIKTSLPILIFGKLMINMLSMVWSILARHQIAKLLRTLNEADQMVNTKQ
jgi:hypothetical protein